MTVEAIVTALKSNPSWLAAIRSPLEASERRAAAGVVGEHLQGLGIDASATDLVDKWGNLRLDVARLNDPALAQSLAASYPEAVPIGAGTNVFDVHG